MAHCRVNEVFDLNFVQLVVRSMYGTCSDGRVVTSLLTMVVALLEQVLQFLQEINILLLGTTALFLLHLLHC